MSSTNRGGSRQNDDFYRTPEWVTNALLPFLDTPGDVLDPCCGDGAVLDCFEEDRVTVGLEIDEARAAQAAQHGHLIEVGDAITLTWPRFSLCITNPPFSLAEDFVRRAINFAVEDGATVAMLLRLAFLESEERKRFHAEFPSDVYPLAHRPSFCVSVKCVAGGGCEWREMIATNVPRPVVCPQCGVDDLRFTTSDSCAYAWFVWDMHPASVRERVERGGRIVVLQDVPPKTAKRIVSNVTTVMP